MEKLMSCDFLSNASFKEEIVADFQAVGSPDRKGLIAGVVIGTTALVAGIALLIFGAMTANPLAMAAGGACMAAGLATLAPCAHYLARFEDLYQFLDSLKSMMTGR
jgi:hypothetical protein